MNIDEMVRNIIGGTNVANSALIDAGEALKADTARVAELGGQSAAQAQSAITLAQEAAGQTAAIEFARNKQQEQNQQLLGLDRTVAENQIQRSISLLDRATSEHEQALGEYTQITNQNFFDDPLGYIVGRMNLPSVANRVNNAATAVGAASQNIAVRTGMMENLNKQVVANSADSIRDAKLADAKARAMQSQSVLTQHELENASRLSAMKMQQVNIIDRVNDNSFKAARLELDNAVRKENAADARSRRAEMDELRNMRLAKMKAEMEDDAALNQRLALVSPMFGFKEPVTKAQLKTLNPKVAQALVDTANTGNLGNSWVQTLQTARKAPQILANDPTDARRSGFLQSMQVLTSHEMERLNSPTEQALNPGLKSMPMDKQLELAGDKVQQAVEGASMATKGSDLSDPKWDKMPGMPYKVNPNVMLDAIQNGDARVAHLANNPLVHAIKAAAVAAGNPAQLGVETEQRALKVIRDKVASREMAPEDAADAVAQYYRAGARKNYEDLKYDLYGFRTQDSYAFTLGAAGAFGGPIKVDLMKPESIKRALMQDVRGVAAARNSSIAGTMDWLFNPAASDIRAPKK
jgi:hypothetical protein